MSRGTAPRNSRYLDEHELKRVLDQVLPALERQDPVRAIRLLVDRLRARVASLGDPYGTLEGSGIWRPTVDDSQENFGSSIEDQLVSAIRDVATRVLDGRLGWHELIDALPVEEMPLAKRIATYLLSVHAAPPQREVVRALTDEQQLSAFLSEYRALLEARFSAVNATNQLGLLRRIADGPAQIPDETDADAYRRWWIYRRLSAIGDQLPEPYIGTLADLREAFGGEDPQPSQRGTWIGPTSPVSEDELAELDPSQVADYLRSWQPPGGVFADSPHGLGRRFAIAVERRAAEYSKLAGHFGDLHATYVREFISGLRKAVEAGTAIDWEAVLVLIRDAIDKERSQPGTFADANARIDRMDVDPHWGWTRKQIAGLLESGLADGPHGIPATASGTVLALLRDLTADPEPDVGYEAQYGGTNSDWDTLSLNTVRPAAISALFRYVVWESSHDEPENRIRDALAILDEHLDPNLDASLAVRSVYGRSTPLLVGVADDWVGTAIPLVWPLSGDLDQFFWAAWAPYLAFWRPHIGVFRLLQDQYRHAVERVGLEPDWRWVANPAEKLGEQLIAFYLADEVAYRPLVSEFFARADEEVAESVLSAFGRAIADDLADRSERLMTLWDERVADITAAGRTRPAELGAFAWWFPHPVLPTTWALDRLLAALRAGAKIEFPEEVVGRLVGAANDSPAEAVEALRLIIGQSEFPWRLERLSESARTILRIALTSDDTKARSNAKRVIGELAMLHGRRDFRELLGEVPAE